MFWIDTRWYVYIFKFNSLFSGKMIDYVKCQECGIEKSREDTFLDIPLPIRPFGSTNAYGCIVR